MSLLRIALLLIIPFIVFYLVINRPGARGNVIARYRVTKAHTVAKALVTAIQAYRQEYGALPKGGYTFILRALHGDNPKKIVFFDWSGTVWERDRAFLDPWGTPYYIDVSNPKTPTVYSFGPNKRDDGGQGDDVVSWR